VDGEAMRDDAKNMTMNLKIARLAIALSSLTHARAVRGQL
jgi:hypothetical protein